MMMATDPYGRPVEIGTAGVTVSSPPLSYPVTYDGKLVGVLPSRPDSRPVCPHCGK